MAYFQHRIATTVFLAALALPALAQQTPPPPAAQASAAKEHKIGQWKERRQAATARRLAALKEQLKLTAAQEPAWATFSAAMQPSQRPERMDPHAMQSLTTPERIDRMRAMRAMHMAQADRQGDATKAFYATLMPEQQHTFDVQSRRFYHRMHTKHGGPRPMKHGHHEKHDAAAPSQ